MKTKILTFFLTLAASVGSILAQSNKIGNLYYLLNVPSYNQATVTINPDNYTGNIIIPASVTYNTNTYSVTGIGAHAFDFCKGLKSVSIPNSVTKIGSSAFYYCSGLTSIEIPNSVTSIGENAFLRCSGITSVTIPSRVKTIEDGAFAICEALTAINVDANNQKFLSLDGVLFDKAQTTLIQYPSGRKGAYSIPNSVTSIGKNAFSYNSGLTSVTIPNSVTSIGLMAFEYCSGLTSLTCEAVTPPTCDRYVFDDIDTYQCVLYVPEGSVDLYKNAKYWEDFWNILPIPNSQSNNTTIEPNATSVDIHWPQVSGAASYELVIKDKEGKIVCTLTFNAQGQLTSIAFNSPARDSESQAAGFAFTVTGLEPGTVYSYAIIAKDASGNVLKEVSGTFTTKALEGIDNVNHPQSSKRKYLQDGQILIQKGEKTYTVTGQDVK